jgi:hypothetical protein
MNNPELLKTSIDDISYLDYRNILNVSSGTLIRNDGHSESNLLNFIANHCREENGLSTSRLIRINQKHTGHVISASQDLARPADGIYTKSKNDILIIKTADCLPLLITDGHTAGLLHLGWRSILAGIIGNFFRTVPDFNRANARAAVGPAIRAGCFEVSPEVALLFDERYRIKIDGKYHVDLEEIVIDELSRNEVNYIYKSEACTFCQPQKYYSYRREGDDVGHMFSFICLGG